MVKFSTSNHEHQASLCFFKQNKFIFLRTQDKRHKATMKKQVYLLLAMIKSN